MNLAYHYPIVYWQTACLTINASADDSSDEGGTTNYGKTATAISNMQNQGTEVALPEINTADFGFRPDAQNNRIIFGLKALCGVGDDDVNQIIANRPYTSLLDFCNRVPLQKTTMISLIKAGSFDELEKIPRYEIMRKYILWRAKKDNPNKEVINMRNIKSVSSLGLIPKELDFLGRVTEYRSYIKKFQDKDNYKLTEAIAQIFFENELLDSLKEGEHYRYTENQEILLNVKTFEKWYKSAITPLNEWLKQPTTLDLYNKAVVANYANTLWDKYCQGALSHWEMETLSFYHGPHELAHVNVQEYGISNWNDIPVSPEVIEITEKESKKGGSKAEKYKLYRVCGTVLDKNKNKHSITLLTTDGVITVKYYSQSFAAYDKSIPYEESDGTKGTDESWFSRGNLLLLTGIRRDDTFFPKTYYDSIYRFHTSLIREVAPTGMLVLENERMKSQ